MEAHVCSRCGAQLTKKDGLYVCSYCRATYEDDFEVRAAKTLEGLLDKLKLERLCNARKILYDAAHAQYPSKEAVVSAAKTVLAIYPDDPLARVYLLSHDADPYQLATLLPRLNLSEPEADEVVRWLVPSLHHRLVGPLHDFAERHFRDRKRTEAFTAIETEATKLDEGIYVPSLARDVFLAYSSSDMPEVLRVLDLLEENGFTCFAAFRNLRHGKGAAEDYLVALKQAMSACSVFVFLSSAASRNATCDAMKVELPYLTNELPGKPRIEYLLSDWQDHLPILVKSTLKKAFPSQEQCRDEEDLVNRVCAFLNGTPIQPAVPVEEPTPAEEPVAEPEPEPVSESEPVTEPLPEEEPIAVPVSDEAEETGSFEIDRNGTLIKYMGGDRVIRIPEEATWISDDAFSSGVVAETIYISKSVGTIELGAFMQCPCLKNFVVDPANPFFQAIDGMLCSHDGTILCAIPPARKGRIVVPEGVQVIDAFAIHGMLTELILPESLVTIKGDVHGSFARLRIPASVKSIARDAFRYSKIESFEVDPKNKTFSSFEGLLCYFGCKEVFCCPPKKSGVVTLPPQCEYVREFSFKSCNEVTDVVLPETVTNIGDEAFWGCDKLLSLKLPPKVTSIGRGAFAYSGLRSITIPASVKWVGPNAFDATSCEISCPLFTRVHLKHGALGKSFRGRIK